MVKIIISKEAPIPGRRATQVRPFGVEAENRRHSWTLCIDYRRGAKARIGC